MNGRLLIHLVGFAYFACSLSARAQPVDLVLAKTYFHEAASLSERDAGALWGIQLYGPLMFANPGTREVVANQADGEGQLAARDGVFVGKLPDSVNIANTAIRWAGVEWTMVVWPLPQDRTARATLLAHELWHRIQDDLGIAMASPANVHLASADGRIWMQLEWRALRKALAASGSGQRSAIEDALAFRAYRRSVFPDRAGEENALEMNEGLAEYTGVVLASDKAEDRRSRAAEALKQAERKESLTRSFAYASGPAYGLLLDAHAPDWRKSIKGVGDLGAALQKALGTKPNAAGDATVVARSGKYDFEALVSHEKQREAEQKAEVARLRAKFIEGPTLRLSLGKSNISFDPNRNHPLGEGTVYLAARLTDAWGELEAPGGVFVSKDWSWAAVPLKVGTQATASGEGWSLQLKDNWEAVQREGGWVLSRKH